jgi:catechol 2,3-dioxygenase-like lactoylglutathione lyase family enzyme
MKFSHTNIITKDWQKLADFYINIFQCKIKPPARDQSGDWLSKGTGVKNAHLKGVHLQLPGFGENGPTLEIYQYEIVEELAPVNANTRGIGHLAFEVKDVATITKRVIEHGGSSIGTISQNQVAGVGEITFVYLRDPDGNILEVQHWDRVKTDNV